MSDIWIITLKSRQLAMFYLRWLIRPAIIHARCSTIITMRFWQGKNRSWRLTALNKCMFSWNVLMRQELINPSKWTIVALSLRNVSPQNLKCGWWGSNPRTARLEFIENPICTWFIFQERISAKWNNQTEKYPIELHSVFAVYHIGWLWETVNYEWTLKQQTRPTCVVYK